MHKYFTLNVPSMFLLVFAAVLAVCTGRVGAVQAGDPIPVAHRGLLRHAPENTLPAFAACLELGMGFELDIRTTKDGHLVVLHDDNVARTINGPSRSVRDMTLKEVRQVDAGSWFGPACIVWPVGIACEPRRYDCPWRWNSRWRRGYFVRSERCGFDEFHFR